MRGGWGVGGRGRGGGSEVAGWSADACEQFQYDRLRENNYHGVVSCARDTVGCVLQLVLFGVSQSQIFDIIVSIIIF